MKLRRQLGISDYEQLLKRYAGKTDSISKGVAKIFSDKLAEAHRASYRRMAAAFAEAEAHAERYRAEQRRRRRRPGD